MKKRISTKMLVLLCLLIGEIVIFGIISGGKLLSVNNIRNILESTTTVSLLAIGSALLMISGEIDLSLGAVGTLGALVVAYCMQAGLPWLPALLIGVLIGVVCGACTAALVNFLNIPSFVATLAMASIAQGFGSMVCGGSQISVKNKVIRTLGSGKLFDYLPYALIISLVLLLVYGIMLKKTAFGRSIYMVGGNREASRLCGLNPKRVSFTLFINAAILATLASTLVVSKLKIANPRLTTLCQFDGLTAAILGGVSLGGGTGGMGGTLIGILILNCFDNATTVVGMNSYWQTIAKGLLLIVALFVDFLISARDRDKVK